VRLDLGAAVKRRSADGNIDAIADRVLERLAREPFWTALHALAARHPDEFVALAKVEAAKRPKPQAKRWGLECPEDAPVFTLTVGQLSVLVARAVAAGTSGLQIMDRIGLARHFGVDIADIDMEVRRGMPCFHIEGSSSNPWFDVQRCLDWCKTPLESRHPHLRLVPVSAETGAES
jgi:hypothetical protein